MNFSHNHLQVVEEEGGELTIEVEEGVLLEVDAVAVLETLVEEVKTQIPVIQVAREPINQIFSSITVKSMDIMHMSAGRDNIIIIKKGQYQSHSANSLSSLMFMTCIEVMSIVSPVECNIVQESPFDIRYLYSSCSNHMIANLEFFLVWISVFKKKLHLEQISKSLSYAKAVKTF